MNENTSTIVTQTLNQTTYEQENKKPITNDFLNLCEALYYNFTFSNVNNNILSHEKLTNSQTNSKICFEYYLNNNSNNTIVIFLSFTMNTNEFHPVIKYIYENTNFNILIINRANLHCNYSDQYFFLGNEDDVIDIINTFYRNIKKVDRYTCKLYGLGFSIGGNYLTRVMNKYKDLFQFCSVICPFVSFENNIISKPNKSLLDYITILGFYRNFINKIFPSYKNSLLKQLTLAEKIQKSFESLYSSNNLFNYMNIENYIDTIQTPCILFVNKTDPICFYSQTFLDKCASNNNIIVVNTKYGNHCIYPEKDVNKFNCSYPFKTSIQIFENLNE